MEGSILSLGTWPLADKGSPLKISYSKTYQIVDHMSDFM